MWNDLSFPELERYLFSNSYDVNTLIELLETFDYERFKEMQADWLKHGRMMWYATGNISKETSTQIVEEAISLLDLQPVAKEELKNVKVVDLVSQSKNLHRADTTLPDPKNENSILLSYY